LFAPAPVTTMTGAGIFILGSYRVSGWWSAGWCADHGADLLR
jgi:hypothetical protein